MESFIFYTNGFVSGIIATIFVLVILVRFWDVRR